MANLAVFSAIVFKTAGSSSRSFKTAARAVGEKSFCAMTMPPLLVLNSAAFEVWWSSAAVGSGTRIDGMPAAAISETEEAPAREIIRWVCAYSYGMLSKKCESSSVHLAPS